MRVIATPLHILIFRRAASMLAVLLLAACTATPRGQSQHPQPAAPAWRLTAEQQALAHANCYGGLPVGQAARGSTELIVRRGYVLEHSSRDKIPLWVCESESAAQLQGHLKRHDKFAPDPALTGPRSLPSDYHDSGFERGHQAPAGNQTVDPALKDETFYMSNIAPQRPTLNSGIWNMLEQKTRSWVQRYGHAYEWTGPILCNESQPARRADCEHRSIGNGVTVPEEFYKIILVQERGEWKAIAFVMPNTDYRRPYELDRYIRSIDWIEQQTGIRFMPEMPADEAQRLKSSTPRMWR
jgi:endonuclease G, mitochondrial